MEEAKHEHVCVVGRSCWKIKPSLPPRPSRRSSFEPTSACPTCPFFCGAIYCQSIESPSHTSNVSRKNKKNVYSIRRTIRRVAIDNLVGKITDREPAFSILLSDCLRISLTSSKNETRTGGDVRTKRLNAHNLTSDTSSCCTSFCVETHAH